VRRRSWRLRIPREAQACPHCDGTGRPVDRLALGMLLRQERERAGLSLSELAAELGISKGFLGKVETGIGRAGTAFAMRVCVAIEAIRGNRAPLGRAGRGRLSKRVDGGL
jgi:hypothetical protein